MSSSRARRRSVARKVRTVFLHLEPLEERCAPSTTPGLAPDPASDDGPDPFDIGLFGDPLPSPFHRSAAPQAHAPTGTPDAAEHPAAGGGGSGGQPAAGGGGGGGGGGGAAPPAPTQNFGDGLPQRTGAGAVPSSVAPGAGTSGPVHAAPPGGASTTPVNGTTLGNPGLTPSASAPPTLSPPNGPAAAAPPTTALPLAAPAAPAAPGVTAPRAIAPPAAPPRTAAPLTAPEGGATAPRITAPVPQALPQAPVASPPLAFEANRGQTAPEVQFLARAPGYTFFLEGNQAVLALNQPRPAATLGVTPAPRVQDVLALRFVGANAHPTATGLDPLPGHSNYFVASRSATDVPTFARLQVSDLYPGIDAVFHADAHGQLEYDLIVRPGANPAAVRLDFAGATGVTANADGSLTAATAHGTLTQHAPALSQNDPSGTRSAVAGAYALQPGGQVAFQVGAHDSARPLVIDPVLSYSTYLGGSGDDQGLGIALDASGNTYVTGHTASTNFPTTTGAYQTSSGGQNDAFITKYDPSGAVAYSTYLGGVGTDGGQAIAVDSSGNAYVTGNTRYGAFPTTAGALRTTMNGSADAFVTKLNAAGNALVYSTYLGGSGLGDESGNGIALDGSGDAFVTGYTNSSTFPTSTGAYQTTSGGGCDAFVSELNASGSALLYSTYLGGAGSDVGNGIALDSSGNAYVTGSTTSSGGTAFPTTSGAPQTTFGGGTQDAFLTKLNSSGSALSFSTYLGGSGNDSGNAVALDGSSNAYVTGATTSSNFPTTSGAYQTTLAGTQNAFVAKYSSSGSLSYASYLGGGGTDDGNGIAVNAAGEAVVAGVTSSSNFPTVGAAQPLAAGGNDAFLARLSANGSALVQGTYWGGSSDDQANAVALDGTGAPYLVGTTSSSDFPTSSGAAQGSSGGGQDAFVAKLALTAMPKSFAPGSLRDPLSAAPTGADQAPSATSASGVRYADGTVTVSAPGLSSDGFGAAWQQSQTWTNAAGYAANGAGGSGVFGYAPQLVAAGGTNTTAVVSGGSARYFDLSSGSYQERLFGKDQLSYNSTAGEFLLTDPSGAQQRFYGFANSLPARQRGQLKSYTDADGNVTSVTSLTAGGQPAELQRSSTVGTTTMTESYLSSYVTSGGNAGLVSNVTLRRQTNGGPWSTVRQTIATYYNGTEAYGNAGNLKLAQVQDGANNTLDTSYYRYYQPGDANGYAGGLKYVLGPDSYARAVAALGDPTTATDAQLAPYADRYFEYDSQQRVTKTIVQAAGSSYTAGGLGTFTYSYTASTNAAGVNSWATKTVETLPDGSTDTVYTNASGQVMLDAFHDAASGSTWLTWTQYDSAGRVTLRAAPSAVSGYDDSKADLLNNQSGNYQYVNDSTGLITRYDYYTTTTATETAAGGVAGYQQDVQLQRGELGTAVLQQTTQYYAHSASGTTVAPVATQTVYRNPDGTGGRTTSYAYTWFSGTGAVQSTTVTLPTVTTAENGPGTADTSTTYYDSLGRATWSKDGEGFLTYRAYDQATSALVKTIVDVDTTRSGDFSGLPTGWSTPTGGGLHLITQLEVDGLGRTTKLTDQAGNISYMVYKDTNYEVRSYVGWNSTTNAPTGPTRVVRQDRPGSYSETLTMSATPNLTGGRPDGSEAVSGVQTLARSYVSAGGQVSNADAYYNLSGVTYSTAANLGTENTNYYRTRYGYDVEGRQDRVQSPTGTIARKVADGQGRVVSQWVGTNDTASSGQWSPTNNTGSANMTDVADNVYDGGLVGDGDLTKSTQHPGGSAADRVKQNWYDWRDRLVASKDGVQATEDTTTHRPITYVTLDNLGAVTQRQQYDGDTLTVSIGSDGVPVAPSASLLRAQSGASYDEQGRVYQSQTFSVNPSTGAVSTNALTTNTWYGHRGQVLATSTPGGLVQQAQTDGAGRVTVSYQTDGAGGSSWSNAASVTGDNVLTQTEHTYDADGNVLLVTTRQRFHDETATGALGNASTAPKARVSYAAAYYDAANRVTAQVDVGTNGGTAYTRPSSVPAASDTMLVSSTTYNAAGWVDTTTDPRGIVTKNAYDNLGRTTKTIAAYTDGTPTSNTNKTTEYTFDGAGHTLTVQADEPGGASEQTQFVYGVTTATGSDVNSNDVLAETRYPDKSTGAPSTTSHEVATVNALGQRKTVTDRNGNVHTLSYDALGRPVSDAVTTLGSGVDGSVRRLEMAYDTQGNAYLSTSYDAASSGNVVNQVQQSYNGLGQLTAEYQAHAGVVNTSTTPKVLYASNEMAGGANNSRPVSLTYPNGRVLTYNYGAGLDNTLSRLTSLSDSSATLEAYSYLGLAMVVKRVHSQPAVDLTYLKQTGEANGDAGDQYTGLDRFGRVVSQRWLNSGTGTATDWFKYGYDRNSNVLYRDNAVNAIFAELYHANGAANGYDQLNQLTAFARGTLSDTNSDGVPDTVASASRNQSWTPDALGNFSSVSTNGTPQSRTHNQQNQVTGVGSATLTFDGNGNLTTDETGKQLVYDAWNRLVQVEDAGNTVLATYKYDALGRRLVESVGGTTTDVYYSAQWQVLEEQVGGSARAQYVWSPMYVDALVERDRDPTGGGTLSERLYAQQDANWNVTALLNTSGQVVERYVYDPYGQVTVLDASWNTRSSSSYAWRYLHQGGRYESATGLYAFRHRDNSPTLSRWGQNDPAGLAAGDPNLYRSESDNPLNATDPSGLMRITPRGVPGVQGGVVSGFEFSAEELDRLRRARSDWFRDFSNYCAGAGDTLSFGGTRVIRQRFNYDEVVDYNSQAYRNGQTSGQVLGVVMIGAGSVQALRGLASLTVRGGGTAGGVAISVSGGTASIATTNGLVIGWSGAAAASTAVGVGAVAWGSGILAMTAPQNPGGGGAPNPEQTAAIAQGIQNEINAWQQIKNQAEAAGQWAEAAHADTQIQILQNELRQLFGLPPLPWLGG